MRIVAIADHPEHVCARYRLHPLRELWGNGNSFEIIGIPSGFWNRHARWNSLGKLDVIIIQRKLLNWWELSQLRKACETLIFDLDDAVFQRDSYSSKGAFSHRRWSRFQKIVQYCDVVVVGNTWLAEQAKRVGAKPGQIRVIPTCVDASQYLVKEHRDHLFPELVWIGSGSTLQGLNQKSELWNRLGRLNPRLHFRIICDSFPQWDDIATIPVHWSEASEASELANADIGIAWMPPDDWSRGKCGLKVLQYLAAGLPVIANPVGVHLEMIEHGKNGLLVETDDEWIQAVQTLSADARLRASMGQAARKSVEEKYGLTTLRQGWSELLSPSAERRAA